MADYEILFNESVWKDQRKVLKKIYKESFQELKNKGMTHARWDAKISQMMSFIVLGKEDIVSPIRYRIVNLQFGLSRSDIEKMFIAEANLYVQRTRITRRWHNSLAKPHN